METVLKRLEIISQMHGADLTQFVPIQVFISTITKRKFKKYSKLASTFKLDYRLILEYLINIEKNKTLTQENDEKYRQIIIGALWLNALLIKIHLNTGDFNRKTKALYAERASLILLLKQNKFLSKPVVKRGVHLQELSFWRGGNEQVKGMNYEYMIDDQPSSNKAEHASAEIIKIESENGISESMIIESPRLLNTTVKFRKKSHATLSFKKNLKPTLSNKIQKTHTIINKARNVIIRAIRTVQASEAILTESSNFTEYLKNFNKIINPALAFAAWIFFIPRFFANIVELCRHFLCRCAMNKNEKSIPESTRRYLLRKNIIALLNDFVSISSGLLNCFFLIGALNVIGTYVTAATFLYDLIVAIIQCVYICHRLKALKNNNQPEQAEDEILILTIDKMIAYKKRKCALQIVYTGSLFLALLLTLPVFGLAPIIPLVAQCMMLLIVIGYIIAQQLNAKTNPKKQILADNPHHLFYQKANLLNEKLDIIEKTDSTCII